MSDTHARALLQSHNRTDRSLFLSIITIIDIRRRPSLFLTTTTSYLGSLNNMPGLRLPHRVSLLSNILIKLAIADLVFSNSSRNRLLSSPAVVREYLHSSFHLYEYLALTLRIFPSTNSGIGRECAILFASEGANVVLADINLEACQKTADIVNERFNKAEIPVKAVAMKCDVSKEDEVAAIVQRAVDEFGRLDVMFNNAGIMHPADDNALNTEEKIWDLTQAINVKGVWYGCKHAIIAMRKVSAAHAVSSRVLRF